jgi:Ca2+-binding EF-hand superfamily protein
MEANSRDAFSIFDQDDDGLISTNDLNHMMKHLGTPLSTAEVHDVIREAGSIDNHTIDYKQFAKLIASGEKISKDIDPEDEARHAFSLFDADADGRISAHEMTAALKLFGTELSAKETEMLIAEATLTSGNTKYITYDVFRKVCRPTRLRSRLHRRPRLTPSYCADAGPHLWLAELALICRAQP